jgi:hypothetical protein
LLHLEDWDPEAEFKRPKLQLLGACHPVTDLIVSFLKLSESSSTFSLSTDTVVVSQARIEMDSSAIYVPATSALLIPEDDLRWRLAEHELSAFIHDLMPGMMEWKWCDSVTGETLALAWDEPPELPELSRWMPTDCHEWGDLPEEEMYERDLRELHELAGDLDCVLVYQYA